MKSGFVYLWYDTVRKLYYLGSHLGSTKDGYTGSNIRFKRAINKRPETFRRRILEHHEAIDSRSLLTREQLWLDLIDSQELHGRKYYNEKRVATGGDIVSTLPKHKRQLHKEKSIAARVKGQLRDRKENPEKWIAISSKAGKASTLANGNKNFKVQEIMAKRAITNAFMTPLGPRPFLTKAADELGISYQYLRKLVERGEGEYYWIEKGNHFYK